MEIVSLICTETTSWLPGTISAGERGTEALAEPRAVTRETAQRASARGPGLISAKPLLGKEWRRREGEATEGSESSCAVDRPQLRSLRQGSDRYCRQITVDLHSGRKNRTFSRRQWFNKREHSSPVRGYFGNWRTGRRRTRLWQHNRQHLVPPGRRLGKVQQGYRVYSLLANEHAPSRRNPTLSMKAS